MYYKYSDFLKNKYGEKVYKLPISIPVTCPNRDGKVATGGCTYCSSIGVGYESMNSDFSVKTQIEETMAKIKKKYKAEKFIAYFQNYTNTYLPIEDFEKYIMQAIMPNIVEISISTRPDCINDDYLLLLEKISKKYNIDIALELGLQTTNYKTLNKTNRGHGLAEYIDACNRINNYNFDLCTHVMLNLPWDDMEDVIETSKVVSVLKNNHVKLHALYILKGTKMAEQYLNNEIKICSPEEYIERTITFLEYLSPDISIQRIIGRAPEKFTIFENWGMSWWKIKEKIEVQMKEKNRYQGKLFNYTNGKAL